MYDRNYWQDHVTDQDGQVIQQGTLLDQANFNNMEIGIADTSLANGILVFKQRQESFDYEDELHTLDLDMNNLPWPFNNKETTVALNQTRESVNYSVAVNAPAYSDGNLGGHSRGGAVAECLQTAARWERKARAGERPCLWRHD